MDYRPRPPAPDGTTLELYNVTSNSLYIYRSEFCFSRIFVGVAKNIAFDPTLSTSSIKYILGVVSSQKVDVHALIVLIIQLYCPAAKLWVLPL